MFEWQTDKIHFFDLSKRTISCVYKRKAIVVMMTSDDLKEKQEAFFFYLIPLNIELLLCFIKQPFA